VVVGPVLAAADAATWAVDGRIETLGEGFGWV